MREREEGEESAKEIRNMIFRMLSVLLVYVFLSHVQARKKQRKRRREERRRERE